MLTLCTYITHLVITQLGCYYLYSNSLLLVIQYFPLSSYFAPVWHNPIGLFSGLDLFSTQFFFFIRQLCCIFGITAWPGCPWVIPASLVILFAVPVTKVKCILRSKVLLILLVLLVKARSGSKWWSKTSKWSKTQYYCYIWQCVSLWTLWSILGYIMHNTLYITCLFG